MVLPNETRFTTVGHIKVEMGQEKIRQGDFVYCRDYLDNPDAVPVDPVQLGSLNDTTNRATLPNGVFHSFHDARAPGFGRKVIILTAPLKPRNIIDFFLLSPDDGAGALGFGNRPEPPAPRQIFFGIPDMERLSILAEKAMYVKGISLAGLKKTAIPLQNPNSERVHDLIPFRTSMGGANPKTVIEDAEGLWLAKFCLPGRNRSSIRIEQAMLDLAKICGIRCVHSRVETVEGRDILLVKRFDREKADCGYLRYRMISGYTALRTDWSNRAGPAWNYASLAEELQRVSTKPVEDSKELFKRMVFNALISNLNDTPGNHSFIAKRTGWNLSPAYDLRPLSTTSTANSGQRCLSMICGIRGRYANAENLLSECRRFCLGMEEAVAVVDSMEERVRNSWYRIACRAGVSEMECKAISGSFCYPGFRKVPKEKAPS